MYKYITTLKSYINYVYEPTTQSPKLKIKLRKQSVGREHWIDRVAASKKDVCEERW